MKRVTARHESGQTLLELIVAVGIVAVVITALVASVTSSLRYSQATRYRSRGVKYAQEGMELTRKLRDTLTWDEFQAYTGGSGLWCLDGLGAFSGSESSGECPIESGSQFWRSVHFIWHDASGGSPAKVEVVVRVSWGERATSSVIDLTTYFTEWR